MLMGFEFQMILKDVAKEWFKEQIIQSFIVNPKDSLIVSQHDRFVYLACLC